MLLQPGRQRLCALPQLPVGEGFIILFIRVNTDMGAVRVGLYVPMQDLDQRLHVLRRGIGLAQS